MLWSDAYVQSADQMTLHPGDETLLITLSFGVLLAWAEGQIVPLAEDWRCVLLTVEAAAAVSSPLRQVALAGDLLSSEPA